MEYPRLGVKVGDRITLDLVNGVSGITGEVAEVLEEPDGGVRQLATLLLVASRLVWKSSTH